MIQKATAMGNWWLAASSRQRTRSCITSHAEFLAKHQIIQMTQAPYSPDLAPCDFWLFPKLKSPLKGMRFQTVNEIQENTTGQLMGIGELCEVPKCLLWRGLRHHCPMYNVSCVLYLQYMSLFFIVKAGYFLDWPRVHIYIHIYYTHMHTYNGVLFSL